MNIITHAKSQNTLCKYENADYLGLCVMNAPMDHLEFVEHLSEDGTLAKIGSDERANLLMMNDEYDIARATSLAMFISMFEKVPPNGKMASTK